ncbi:kinase-like domain-containing protein [Zopfochytrium polystomum]|nr:kinase-like domain-containing protein [Zopfochytrium polystomum]
MKSSTNTQSFHTPQRGPSHQPSIAATAHAKPRDFAGSRQPPFRSFKMKDRWLEKIVSRFKRDVAIHPPHHCGNSPDKATRDDRPPLWPGSQSPAYHNCDEPLSSIVRIDSSVHVRSSTDFAIDYNLSSNPSGSESTLGCFGSNSEDGNIQSQATPATETSSIDRERETGLSETVRESCPTLDSFVEWCAESCRPKLIAAQPLRPLTAAAPCECCHSRKRPRTRSAQIHGGGGAVNISMDPSSVITSLFGGIPSAVSQLSRHRSRTERAEDTCRASFGRCEKSVSDSTSRISSSTIQVVDVSVTSIATQWTGSRTMAFEDIHEEPSRSEPELSTAPMSAVEIVNHKMTFSTPELSAPKELDRPADRRLSPGQAHTRSKSMEFSSRNTSKKVSLFRTPSLPRSPRLNDTLEAVDSATTICSSTVRPTQHTAQPSPIAPDRTSKAEARRDPEDPASLPPLHRRSNSSDFRAHAPNALPPASAPRTKGRNKSESNTTRTGSKQSKKSHHGCPLPPGVATASVSSSSARRLSAQDSLGVSTTNSGASHPRPPPSPRTSTLASHTHSNQHRPQHMVIETRQIYDKLEVSPQSRVLLSPLAGLGEAQGKINQYYILSDIASGSFGKVFLCRDEFSGQYYACKVVSKARLLKTMRSVHWRGGAGSAGLDPFLSIKREIAILKKLSKHKNINLLVEVLDDENDDSLYMIFELCEYGPIMQVSVMENVNPYCERHARKYFRDMLLAIEYLHHKGIIHRDLKPENILLNASRDIQIADFGISHDCEGQTDILADKNATLMFSPPEAWQANHDLHGKSADMWSLGVTLYTLVHGHLPFTSSSVIDLYEQIVLSSPPVSRRLSPALQDILRCLLEKDPTKRASIRDLRAHPWVTEHGRDPLVSVEENCGLDEESEVTEREVEEAVSPVTMLWSKIKTTLQRFRTRSKNSESRRTRSSSPPSRAGESFGEKCAGAT